MVRRPPRSTRTYTLVPYPSRFRSDSTCASAPSGRIARLDRCTPAPRGYRATFPEDLPLYCPATRARPFCRLAVDTGRRGRPLRPDAAGRDRRGTRRSGGDQPLRPRGERVLRAVSAFAPGREDRKSVV